MIATSSPSLIIISMVFEPASGISTYSKLMVTKQLPRTLCTIPLYRLSRASNNFDRGKGALRVSESLDVYELAEAKYRIVNCPSFVEFDMVSKIAVRNDPLAWNHDSSQKMNMQIYEWVVRDLGVDHSEISSKRYIFR